MINSIYEQYLLKQKKLWLERKSKGKDPTSELLNESEIRYEKSAWLSKAIKQARHAITTHASTFTHPDAKTSCFRFSAPHVNNGLLSTNNVNYENAFDLFGNAATDSFVKEIYLFLIESVNEQTIWDHLKSESNEIKKFIQSYKLDFDEAKTALSKLMIDPEPPKTHKLLKQVYFPVGDNYHLLSLLTPSVVTAELLSRLNLIRFSEIAKQARGLKRDTKFSEYDYEDIFDLTEVAFGGSKPQNVSVLNSQNAGRAYLLSSCPPIFEKRQVRLPNSDFFKQCLYWKKFSAEFESLKKYMAEINNRHTRKKIKRLLRQIVGDILFISFCVRQNERAWSKKENYKSLPLEQKIWLDDAYLELRESENEWRDEIARRIAKWILDSFDEFCGSKLFSSTEITELKSIAIEALDKDKEFF